MAKKRGYMRRKFKGIWIKKDIWNCRELTPTCRVLLAEIDSLSDREEGCTASNSYFARFFGISVRSVIRGVALLHKYGLITSVIDKADSNARTMFVVPEAIAKLAIVPSDKMAIARSSDLVTKWLDPSDKMAVHYIEDNTMNNTGGEKHSPSPVIPADQKEEKTPETKAGRAWARAREMLEDQMHFPDEFLEFFDIEVMGRWNKFEVSVAVVRDWHCQLYLKYGVEMVAGILSDYNAGHKGWQPKLADVVKMVNAKIKVQRTEKKEEHPQELSGQEFRDCVMKMGEQEVMETFRTTYGLRKEYIKQWRPELFGKKEAQA